MKKTKFLILMFVFFLLNQVVNAQETERHFCGTRCSEQEYATARSLQVSPRPKETLTAFVKVQFFIVCDGITTGAPVSINDINDAFNGLNAKFAASGVQFTQCTNPRYIINTPYFHLGYPNYFGQTQAQQAIDEQGLCGGNDFLTAINIYVVGDIASGFVGGYTYLNGLLNGKPYNRIFMAANGNSDPHFSSGLSLAHEMGHFFGLLHTNGYWSSGTNELVNGSNCLTAGDLICDTPADPQLAT